MTSQEQVPDLVIDEATVAAARERPDDVAVVLTELSSLLVDSEPLHDTLQRIVDLAARTMPGCDAAGVTLVHPDGRFATAAYTDERTLAVDKGQYDRDDGPCIDSIRNRRINRVDVHEARTDWPDFIREAKSSDIRSFLAAPLVVGGGAIGAVNLYSRSQDGFDALDEKFIALLTGQAAVAVANARRYGEVQALADQMGEAIKSRAMIEQAKGVLMARHAVGPDDAFAVLRNQSQRRNVKLRHIAKEVVESTRSASGRAHPDQLSPPVDPAAVGDGP